MALELGSVIDGKYEVVRLLGEGGMGAVFEGRNTRIHRRVAIKVLHGKVAQRPDMVRRFEREASAAARIGSKHIVDVLDLGDLPNGDRYMVMEYLEGKSLSDYCKKTRLAPEVLFPWVSQLLKGLGAAHAAGIIHRDLKPDNIYITPDGVDGADFVKVLDFGVSKFKALDEEEGNMTRTGAVMGTPYYMAPEQARGKGSVDHQTDLYAVGVMMFRGLAGVPPYDGSNLNELMFKIALEEPRKLTEFVPDIDLGVVAIIERAMQREKEDRYPSAAAFREDIRTWLRGRGLYTSTQTGTHAAMIAASIHTPPGGIHAPGMVSTGDSLAGGPFATSAAMRTGPSFSNSGQLSGSGSVTSGGQLSNSGQSLGSSFGAGGAFANSQANNTQAPTYPGVTATPVPPTRSATPKIIGGLVALLAIAAGVFLFARAGGDSAAAGASSAAVTVPLEQGDGHQEATATPTATATAELDATADPDPSSSAAAASPSASASSVVVPPPHHPNGHAAPWPHSTARPPRPKPTAAPTTTATGRTHTRDI